MCIKEQTPHIIRTEDGSPTIYTPRFKEHYHSVHGAVQESRHIFISAGLAQRLHLGVEGALSILEFGFGTGLNALLSLLYATENAVPLRYTSLELYPIGEELYRALDFGLEIPKAKAYIEALHTSPWGMWQKIEGAEGFELLKLQTDMQHFEPQSGYDLIYFDAFSPEAQPELWSEDLFRRLYEGANPQAVLTTYCAKGEVRRRLERAGWRVERLAGPPGKREMLRATKENTTSASPQSKK